MLRSDDSSHVMDDPVDVAILREVSRDARATLAQLSERVGLGGVGRAGAAAPAGEHAA